VSVVGAVSVGAVSGCCLPPQLCTRTGCDQSNTSVVQVNQVKEGGGFIVVDEYLLPRHSACCSAAACSVIQVDQVGSRLCLYRGLVLGFES
jgi:hypothetical protein